MTVQNIALGMVMPKYVSGPDRSHRIVAKEATEMAELTGLTRKEVEASPAAVAKEVAARTGCVVVLKGSDTLIASPSGVLLINRAGNPGLGTSGSGDTLAGVIAGLCARGTPLLQAAAWGVHLHAKAGDRLGASVVMVEREPSLPRTDMGSEEI